MPEAAARKSATEAKAGTASDRMAAAETVGSVLWLAMDACWMMGLKVPATLLVGPCVLAHAIAFRHTPRSWVWRAVAGAMTCWLGMNIAWMVADVWALPRVLVIAKSFFALSCVLLAVALSSSRWRPEARAAILAGFRRLRFGIPQRRHDR